MITDVISVHRNTAFKDIAALFAVHRISAVPVLDDNRRVVGVVTETDLLSKESAHNRPRAYPPAIGRRRTLRGKAEATRAHELMTAPAITVDVDTPIPVASQRLEHHDIRHLPVIAEDGTLLGIVGRSDLLRVFLRPDRDIATEINEEVLDGTNDAHADVIDGVAVLRGRSPSKEALASAVADAREVEGVIAVIEHVTCEDETNLAHRDH
jgi:CBS-domain-containing membrane protein